MLSADLLRRLRNDLPMPVTIAALGREGPPAKMSEGYFRFLCPHCGEMRATVNPRTNLAHCFCCKKNLNNIDLLLTLDYDFCLAVACCNAGWSTTRPSSNLQTAPGSTHSCPGRCRTVRRCTDRRRSATRRQTLRGHVAPSPPRRPLFSKIPNNSANSTSPGQNPYSVNLATNAIRIWSGTSHASTD